MGHIGYKEWIIATVAGNVVALVIPLLALLAHEYNVFITFLSMSCTGACIGYFQYNVLRKKTTIGKEWIVYNTLAAALSSLVLDILPTFILRFVVDTLPVELSYVIFGITLSSGINGYIMPILTYGLHGVILGTVTASILRKDGFLSVKKYILCSSLAYAAAGLALSNFIDFFYLLIDISPIVGYYVDLTEQLVDYMKVFKFIFTSVLMGAIVGFATAYSLRIDANGTNVKEQIVE